MSWTGDEWRNEETIQHLSRVYQNYEEKWELNFQFDDKKINLTNFFPNCHYIQGKVANNPYPYTDRRCGLFNGYRNDCEDLKEQGWEQCYTCKTPLCNGALMEKRPILSVVLIFGIIMLIYIWNFDTTPFLD